MDRKLYYANVGINVVEHFETKLKEREDRITIISKSEPWLSLKGDVMIITYVLEAEEGVINPRWKV